jgi:hypothetical protein
MNHKLHFESLTDELESLKDRVQNFIGEVHQVTKGDWRESVLRSALEQKLPGSVRIGRGFILDEHEPSTECDILIFRSDHPTHFQSGDLVFVSPQAVVGVIEVKSKLRRGEFKAAIQKLAHMGRLFQGLDQPPFLALFSYEVQGNPDQWFREDLPAICDSPSRRIELISLGCHSFVKWWDRNPSTGAEGPAGYSCWHSYVLERMSAGYFITNVIDAASGGKVSACGNLWFPPEGKENTDRRQIIPSRFLAARNT